MFAINQLDPYEWSGRYNLGRATEHHAETFNLSGSLWFAFTTLQWQGFKLLSAHVVQFRSIKLFLGVCEKKSSTSLHTFITRNLQINFISKKIMETLRNFLVLASLNLLKVFLWNPSACCSGEFAYLSKMVNHYLSSGYERAPRSVAGRILSVFWFTFITITLLTYTASLVNWLFWASTVHGKDYTTSPIAVSSFVFSWTSVHFKIVRYNENILLLICFSLHEGLIRLSLCTQDLEHLVMSNKYKYGCVRGGSTYRYLTEV